MGHVFLLALLAALYPTLLAATTVMLMLPHPKRLLLGYLLGAAMTSITLGLVIVFTLRDSGFGAQRRRRRSAPVRTSPSGCIALVDRLRPRHRSRPPAGGTAAGERKAAKSPQGPPRWQRFLNRGSARVTFAVGAVLTLPGATYITALYRIADEDLAAPVTVAVVLAFNAIMLMLLESPCSPTPSPQTGPLRRSTASRPGCANAAASGRRARRSSSAP